jgi:ParB family chromosome partitioning protein
MQPIAVRRLPGGRYEILAGERRWRAAQQAGLMKIPAVVHDLEDERLLEFALVENLMREDLNPIEESLAYKSLMDDFGMTQKQIAGRVGKRRATIANMLRLLSLSRSVRDRVEDGSLSMGHARALASLSSPQRQEELAAQIVARDLSVRQVESMVARMNAEGEIERRKGARRRDPNVEAAESKLQSLLGTRVRIVQGKKGGRLEIHYYGDEELQRIYNLVHDAAGGKS